MYVACNVYNIFLINATFTSEKYELTHFTHKSKRFDMTVNLCIENSIIKSKSNV